MSRIKLQGLTDINDPFYRYTMAVPVYDVCKNRIIVKNIDAVAKDIGRDPQMIASYIGYKNGCKTNYKNYGKGKNSLFEIICKNEVDLMMLIREFIQKVVLCVNCNNPETDIDEDSKNPSMICRSCGGRTDIDMEDKYVSKLFKTNTSKSNKKERREKKNKQKSKSTSKSDDDSS